MRVLLDRKGAILFASQTWPGLWSASIRFSVIPDDATTGRSIQPSLPTFADRYNGQSD